MARVLAGRSCTHASASQRRSFADRRCGGEGLARHAAAAALTRRQRRAAGGWGRAGGSPATFVVRAAASDTEMPEALKTLVAAFSAVPDPMLRYKQLLHFAEKLEALPAEHHTPENKVEGCVSQVWVRGTLAPDGTVSFQAESDSQLTKGLAALLVRGLSGATPDTIAALSPDFIEMLGLKQSLTPSRNNGFLNMFLKMQKITQDLASAPSGTGAGSDANLPMAEKIQRAIQAELSPSR